MEDVALSFGEFVDRWIGVWSVEIEPRFQGQKLGWWMLAELIDAMYAQNTLLTLHAGEQNGGPDTVKLHQYWRRFGLHPAGQDNIFAMNLNLLWPRSTYMAKRRPDDAEV